jgi:hypothetical protein
MYKRDKPCDNYFGNVCSGFGGSLTCYICGWDRVEHKVRCKVRVEKVDTGEWEAWCKKHPLPNGDTGEVFDNWRDAIDHALKHTWNHWRGR